MSLLGCRVLCWVWLQMFVLFFFEGPLQFHWSSSWTKRHFEGNTNHRESCHARNTWKGWFMRSEGAELRTWKTAPPTEHPIALRILKVAILRTLYTPCYTSSNLLSWFLVYLNWSLIHWWTGCDHPNGFNEIIGDSKDGEYFVPKNPEQVGSLTNLVALGFSQVTCSIKTKPRFKRNMNRHVYIWWKSFWNSSLLRNLESLIMK